MELTIQIQKEMIKHSSFNDDELPATIARGLVKVAM